MLGEHLWWFEKGPPRESRWRWQIPWLDIDNLMNRHARTLAGTVERTDARHCVIHINFSLISILFLSSFFEFFSFLLFFLFFFSYFPPFSSSLSFFTIFYSSHFLFFLRIGLFFFLSFFLSMKCWILLLVDLCKIVTGRLTKKNVVKENDEETKWLSLDSGEKKNKQTRCYCLFPMFIDMFIIQIRHLCEFPNRLSEGKLRTFWKRIFWSP